MQNLKYESSFCLPIKFHLLFDGKYYIYGIDFNIQCVLVLNVIAVYDT